MMNHTAATATTAASTHIAIHATRWIRASDELTPQTSTRSPRFATMANRLTGKPNTIAQGLVNTREQDEHGPQPKGEDVPLTEPIKRYVDTAIERDVTSAIETRRTSIGGWDRSRSIMVPTFGSENHILHGKNPHYPQHLTAGTPTGRKEERICQDKGRRYTWTE